jgi:hypothetical protein
MNPREKEMHGYRGSRKHVLDWVESRDFPTQLQALLEPTGAHPVAGTWLPGGYSAPKEARLESYGPRFLPGIIDWSSLRDWWLAHKRGANTPNWDLASVCELGGRRGLVLVEAKANVQELKEEGKALSDDASAHSKENHTRIAEAISEARDGLSRIVSGVTIDIASHYQLANRLAFAWKLASLGIPVVLVYLGFTGDAGIVDAGDPLLGDSHWHDVFTQHAASVVPQDIFERRLEVRGTPLWMLIRSRLVLEPSRKRGRT